MYEQLIAMRRSLDRSFIPARPRPAHNCASQELADELLLELEERQPNSLVMHLATGFPSALLCVLAAGVLAGVLAGREVGVQVPTMSSAQAATVAGATLQTASHALANRHQQLKALENQAVDVQAVVHQPQPPVVPPVADQQTR